MNIFTPMDVSNVHGTKGCCVDIIIYVFNHRGKRIGRMRLSKGKP